MQTGSCPEISALSSLVDGELEEDKNEAIKLHVQNCPTCADQINRLQASDRFIRRYLAEPMVFSDSLNKRDCIVPEAMTAYLHDLLQADEKKRVEEHFDGCDVCLSEFSSLAKATNQLERSKTEPLPDALRQRVEGLLGKSEQGKEQVARLVVRLAKEGLEIVRDALFPPTISLQELFVPVSAYRTAGKSSMPSSVLLKKTLPGIQLSLMLRWQAENRAGLEVKITDEKLNSLAGQRVSLRRDESLVCSQRTGTQGNIVVSDLEVGTYRLGIITLDKEFYVDLELDKA